MVAKKKYNSLLKIVEDYEELYHKMYNGRLRIKKYENNNRHTVRVEGDDLT